tara:strand:+ start:735 stop:1979 length:1245 start_codon:yes stop_codon:yes gene_type:complete
MRKKILHLSYDDFTGAGLAALRFHNNLKKNNFVSYLLVNKKKSNSTNVIEISKKNIFNHFLNKSEFFFLTERNKYAFYNKNRYLINDINEINFFEKFKPDIVIFHWISNFINPILFKQIYKKYKCRIFWNIIDIAPLTGGCHINWGCINFKSTCNNCPAVGTLFQSRPKNTLKNKIEIFKNLKVNFLYTGKWMGKQIENSSIAKNHKSYKLMIPVDEKLFKPKPLIKRKNSWRINTKKKIILFRSSSHLRKGIDILVSAIDHLINKSYFLKNKFCLLSIGDKFAEERLKNIDIEYINLGNIRSENKLSEVYQLSDIFVSPSIDDVGPMMINEAVISGLPVVSFNIGVAEDLIINKINGYIVKKKSYKNLSNSLKKYLNSSNEEINKMKKKSRAIGVEKTSLKKHIKIFNKIIKS